MTDRAPAHASLRLVTGAALGAVLAAGLLAAAPASAADGGRTIQVVASNAISSNTGAFDALSAGGGSADRAAAPTTAPATAPAVIGGLVTARPIIRTASAETFRPAPLPNDALSVPGTTIADADAPSLHPDLLKMHDAGAGGSDSTSSDYDHMARVKPAGGMSLSIPMQ